MTQPKSDSGHLASTKGAQVPRDNDGKPRQLYVDRLQAMTDDELAKETEHKIWLSAYAANNPRSDYHWHCDATYDECARRGKPEIYSRAYKRASA